MLITKHDSGGGCVSESEDGQYVHVLSVVHERERAFSRLENLAVSNVRCEKCH